MSEPEGAFWEDHRRDMEDAEYCTEFERQLHLAHHTAHCLANVLWDQCDCPRAPHRTTTSPPNPSTSEGEL